MNNSRFPPAFSIKRNKNNNIGNHFFHDSRYDCFAFSDSNESELVNRFRDTNQAFSILPHHRQQQNQRNNKITGYRRERTNTHKKNSNKDGDDDDTYDDDNYDEDADGFDDKHNVNQFKDSSSNNQNKKPDNNNPYNNNNTNSNSNSASDDQSEDWFDDYDSHQNNNNNNNNNDAPKSCLYSIRNRFENDYQSNYQATNSLKRGVWNSNNNKKTNNNNNQSFDENTFAFSPTSADATINSNNKTRSSTTAATATTTTTKKPSSPKLNRKSATTPAGMLLLQTSNNNKNATAAKTTTTTTTATTVAPSSSKSSTNKMVVPPGFLFTNNNSTTNNQTSSSSTKINKSLPASEEQDKEISDQMARALAQAEKIRKQKDQIKAKQNGSNIQASNAEKNKKIATGNNNGSSSSSSNLSKAAQQAQAKFQQRQQQARKAAENLPVSSAKIMNNNTATTNNINTNKQQFSIGYNPPPQSAANTEAINRSIINNNNNKQQQQQQFNNNNNNNNNQTPVNNNNNMMMNPNFIPDGGFHGVPIAPSGLVITFDTSALLELYQTFAYQSDFTDYFYSLLEKNIVIFPYTVLDEMDNHSKKIADNKSSNYYSSYSDRQQRLNMLSKASKAYRDITNAVCKCEEPKIARHKGKELIHDNNLLLQSRYDHRSRLHKEGDELINDNVILGCACFFRKEEGGRQAVLKRWKKFKTLEEKMLKKQQSKMKSSDDSAAAASINTNTTCCDPEKVCYVAACNDKTLQNKFMAERIGVVTAIELRDIMKKGRRIDEDDDEGEWANRMIQSSEGFLDE